MNRRLKQLSTVLRRTGIVLICISLVLAIYVTASGHSANRDFQAKLREHGVEPGFADRVAFDRTYFSALSRAAALRDAPEAQRAAAVTEAFRGFTRRVDEAQATARPAQTAAAWQALQESFDQETFLALHAGAEGGFEARETRELVEYLDSFTAAAGKGKLAKLKPASSEPFYQETWQGFADQHGDEAGSYLDFLRAARLVVDEALAGGESIKDIKSFLSERLDWDVYQDALSRAEQSAEAAEAESVTLGLTEWLEQGGDAQDYFKELWQRLSEKQPELDELAFLQVLPELLADESYDGTAATLIEEVQDRTQALQSASFDTAMEAYGHELVAEADRRSRVAAIVPFWWAVSHFIEILGLGILLLLLGILLDKFVVRRTLREAERQGVKEEEGVLLRVDHLCQYFRSGDDVTKAVDDVSFFIRKGEVFGLVGESGCGKTTTGRTIINLYDPTSGDVYFKGLRISSNKNGWPVLNFTLRKDAKAAIHEIREELKVQLKAHPEQAGALKAKAREDIRKIRHDLNQRLSRAQDEALVSDAEKANATRRYRAEETERLTRAFEAESASLSGEALQARKALYEQQLQAVKRDNVMTRMQMIFQDPIASIDPRMTVREIIAEGLRIRGITDKAVIDQKVYEMLDLVGLVSEHADRYPHEFSGGQRQRIGIARAIALEPELIIADEPISALDVSIQAQVINLLNELREKMGLTILFIAHNLSVVKYFSDRIAVMYYGHIVEMTTSQELFDHPLHPYTKALLSAIPYPDPHYEKTRKRIEYNPNKAHDYSVDKPTLREVAPGHWIRCNDAEFAAYRKELGL